MKEYTIYINKSLPNGGFDICLNKTLTECDIVVYSIPFRESLTIADDGIVIKQFLEDLLAYKSIYPDSADITVSSDIAEFLKESFATLKSSIEINSTASTAANKIFNPVGARIEIDQMAEFIINSMTGINSSIQIGINPVFFNLNKYFDTNSQFSIKSDIEEFSATKQHSILSTMHFDSSMSIYYWLLIEPDPLEISISGSIDLSNVRYRLLEEVDPYLLNEIDNMSLEDLELIVLD